MPIKAARERLIFALDDVPSLATAIALVELLKGHVGMFKVGKESFTAFGPQLVTSIIARGERVFLDLKYHDIPHTVARAAAAATGLGVSLMSVHAAGGRHMLGQAAAAVRACAQQRHILPPRVVAVTVLTSLGDEDLAAIGFGATAAELVPRLARLACEAGLDGVVASPREIAAIRDACGPDFVVVTPGIRKAGAGEGDDQKRILTAFDATRAGADYLVVGRPIRQAAEPARAADAIVCEIALGLGAGEKDG